MKSHERETLLAEARRLLSKTSYTHEDAARVSGLLQLSERLAPGEIFPEGREVSRKESAALDDYLRGRMTKRDLETGTAGNTLATSVLVQQGFFDRLAQVLKQVDALTNPDYVQTFETPVGSPCVLPQIDGTQAAVKTTEGQQDSEIDPGLASLALAAPPHYSAGIVPVSMELVQDSAFDIAGVLAAIFAIRIARGAGPDLVSALLSAAKQGVLAAGSSKNTGGSESGGTTIGSGDLFTLRKSVNAAYRSSPKCAWLMNDNVLATIDSVVDKNGRLLFYPPEYGPGGERLLLGFPVRISPSMPDIALNAKTVAFGDLGYFATRFVKQATKVEVLTERFAEFGQVGYRAQARINGGLLGVTATDSPVKYLVQAAA